MLLLVGLGNPGRAYARNRHNVGYMALDAIVESHGFAPFRKRFNGDIAEGRIAGVRALALKPRSYMNESGRPVAEAARFYKIPPERIIVIHDDVDLAPGKVRAKLGGGNAGHNGLRSIDSHLGNGFWRVRVGVGRPAPGGDVSGYVLRNFAAADRDWLAKTLPAIAAALPLLVGGDAPGFMSRVALLTKPPRPRARKAPPAKGKAPAGAGAAGGGKAAADGSGDGPGGAGRDGQDGV